VNRPRGYGLPEPGLARRRFDRAAPSVDEADFVGAEAAARLVDRLRLFALEPRVVIDLGAGTARASRALAQAYPAARILAIDASGAMLEQAALTATERGAIEPINADAQQLPCRDDAADLIFANLLLPWVDPARVLAECARVLRPGGLAIMTTLGPDTLIELRRAWARVDDFIHVHGFIDMHDIGDLAAHAGLVEPVVDVDRLTLDYASVAALVADLHAAGVANSAVGRYAGLMSRDRWAAFESALVAGSPGGRIAVSVELVFLQAWAPARLGPQAAATDGVTRIAAESLARAVRRRR